MTLNSLSLFHFFHSCKVMYMNFGPTIMNKTQALFLWISRYMYKNLIRESTLSPQQNILLLQIKKNSQFAI